MARGTRLLLDSVLTCCHVSWNCAQNFARSACCTLLPAGCASMLLPAGPPAGQQQLVVGGLAGVW
jgi:hypothetical protein